MNDNDAGETGIVFDIQHFSVHDGPGIRTNVFLKGCPLRCRWCCNPESQKAAPQMTFDAKLCIGCGECARRCRKGAATADRGKAEIDLALCSGCDGRECLGGCYARALKLAGGEMTVEEVMTGVLRDRNFYRERGGVTFSGGEPFFQPRFLAGLAAAAKQAGLDRAVETCLCVPWENIAPCVALMNTFLCDIKHVDRDKLRDFAGADWDRVRDNLSRLARAGVTLVARVPVVVGFNATPEEIARIASFAADLGIRKTHLLPYHALGRPKYARLGRDYPMPDAPLPGRELTLELRKAAERTGMEVFLGG